MIFKHLHVFVVALLLLLLCSNSALAAGASWAPLLMLPQPDSGVLMEQPIAVAMDTESQRYYVVDAAKGQLVSFASDGGFLAAFNAGGQLKNPVAMVKSASGSLWVIERSSNELFYINPKQKKLKRFPLTYADGERLFPARL